ncbi:MAG TPA: trehalase family glycosidase [Bryobacteraceae bacterium]|nr:trehalase family glycosidase [Bryobacteraceae bacterium]
MRARFTSLLCSGVAAALLFSAQPAPILSYIQQTWIVLTRSNRDLAKAAADPKFKPAANGRWPVYVSRAADLRSIETQLRREMAPSDFQKIEIRALPDDASEPREPGLLYLPNPYVVPGGRFNEMYGWDSYFIQIGLLRDNQLALAQDMADNFVYEIRQYGKILNANRTYYLTRSQPPFFTEMLLAVYQRTHDRKWLEDALPAMETYYRYWTSEPHLTPGNWLSRYFDLGDGPAPEVVAAERDTGGRSHYDLVKQYFRTHRVADYDVNQYYDAKTDRLTKLFYKGDRSMRESGFDPSNRFGPFNADIIHYNPVCLNSLLYVMEIQAAEIEQVLGRQAEAAAWRQRGKDRAARINRLMWDSQDGLYYDYDFVHRQVRRYPFLTTFYPLWAGIASREQAARVERNLPKFERPGGLQTSTYQSGNQWDAPFGWAPLEMLAVEGLRHYGYRQDADRISMEFLSLILDEYRKHGRIVEKYDVVHRTTDVSANIHFGYTSNEAGFGWTNAVFTKLYDELPARGRHTLLGTRAASAASNAR